VALFHVSEFKKNVEIKIKKEKRGKTKKNLKAFEMRRGKTKNNLKTFVAIQNPSNSHSSPSFSFFLVSI
jgi:hypothetical protein